MTLHRENITTEKTYYQSLTPSYAIDNSSSLYRHFCKPHRTLTYFFQLLFVMQQFGFY
ncbi:MAG: hypothetical protein MUF45_03930 [Spirosomaceae bacterium]|nr:hypothetical protein [Spirosomataceae bacterium]